jgi:hypothetical protein
MVAALMAAMSEGDVAAIRKAAASAPGPLSALAAAIAALAARLLAQRHLARAVLAEPVDQSIEPFRLAYRRSLTDEIASRLHGAEEHLPDQDATMIAPAILGALLEGILGPIAPDETEAAKSRNMVQILTLLALRAAGVVDARARGLVVQIAVPVVDDSAALTNGLSRRP